MKYTHILLLLALALAFQASHAAKSRMRRGHEDDDKPRCRNSRTVFAEDMGDWQAITDEDTYEVNSEGLMLKLLPPSHYERKKDNATGLPYNTEAGQGSTFNSSTYMRYGEISAKIKSARPGGAVTAFILIADRGDEIDYELLGDTPHEVDTNYFWGEKIQYTVNGASRPVSGEAIQDDFHTYTIKWQPDRIVWEIDGKPTRTVKETDTCKDDVCQFPTHPARVQLGLWDGSIQYGTAEWAHGPIRWDKESVVTAVVQEVEIKCNPKYNIVE